MEIENFKGGLVVDKDNTKYHTNSEIQEGDVIYHKEKILKDVGLIK